MPPTAVMPLWKGTRLYHLRQESLTARAAPRLIVVAAEGRRQLGLVGEDQIVTHQAKAAAILASSGGSQVERELVNQMIAANQCLSPLTQPVISVRLV